MSVAVKQERHDEAEIRELADKIMEANKTKMLQAAQQSAQQANQRTNFPPGGQLNYMPMAKKAKLDEKPDEDYGKFGWTTIGKQHLPYIFRNGIKYCSVKMVEQKVLNKYLSYLHEDVCSCTCIRSYYISDAESKLLTEINTKHCDNQFGKDAFTQRDLIVRMSDAEEFYNYLELCYHKLVSGQYGPKDRCGFIRINKESVVPFTVRQNKKYVPLFYFEGETDNLKLKADELDGWDLAYLKFCCKVQGIRNELFANETCEVISLNDIKSYFPPGTGFEDYWPNNVPDSHLLMLNRNSTAHYNGMWTKQPAHPPPVVPKPSNRRSPNVNQQIAANILTNQQMQAVNGWGLVGQNFTAISGNHPAASQLIRQMGLAGMTQISQANQNNRTTQRNTNTASYYAAPTTLSMPLNQNQITPGLVRTTGAPTSLTTGAYSTGGLVPSQPFMMLAQQGLMPPPAGSVDYAAQQVARGVNQSQQQHNRQVQQTNSSVTSLSLTPPPKKAKTQAERQRAYRLRQKKLKEAQNINGDKLDETAGFQQDYSLTHNALNSLPLTTPPKIAKTSAERQRACRLRKKQQKEAKTQAERQRAYRLRKKKLKEAQNINSDNPTKKSYYQRQYRLREKLKTKLNSESAEMIPIQNDSVSSEHLTVVTTTQLTSSSLDVPDEKYSLFIPHEPVVEIVELPTTNGKNVAQEKLEEQHSIKDELIKNEDDFKLKEEFLSSFKEESVQNQECKIQQQKLKKAKTKAERQREYRLRLKKMKGTPPKKAKTQAERQRAYRLRLKKRKGQVIRDKSVKKSKADYQREYRLRKKLKANLNSSSNEMISIQEAELTEEPVAMAQLMPHSPDTGPIHEPVVEIVELPTANLINNKNEDDNFNMKEKSSSFKEGQLVKESDEKKLKGKRQRKGKTQAERQREYRIRLKKRKGIPIIEKVKKTHADYQREYRLRKKLKAKLNSGSAETILPTAHSKPSSFDAEPLIIIQHEADLAKDFNFKETYQLPSQPILSLPDDEMQQISNQHMENLDYDGLTQPETFYEGDFGEHTMLAIKDGLNEDDLKMKEESLSKDYISTILQ